MHLEAEYTDQLPYSERAVVMSIVVKSFHALAIGYKVDEVCVSFMVSYDLAGGANISEEHTTSLFRLGTMYTVRSFET
jgi:hypothetical protein